LHDRIMVLVVDRKVQGYVSVRPHASLAFALALFFVLDARANEALPPPGAALYVIWGHSEAGGHDSMESAQTILHGDHIWAALDAKMDSGMSSARLKQNPPANTFGSEGPSPNNYFADELVSEAKATDVVLLKCFGHMPGQDWRVGISGAIDALQKCKSKVQYAIDTWGLKLAGGVTYCCAGDALDEESARAFSDKYQTFVAAVRSSLGFPSLPFVSAITPLTDSCNRGKAAVETIKLLRRNQAAIKVHGVTWVDFHAVGLPRSCFHLTGAEQARLGRIMAQAMPKN